jgi:hypothetical protein
MVTINGMSEDSAANPAYTGTTHYAITVLMYDDTGQAD